MLCVTAVYERQLGLTSLRLLLLACLSISNNRTVRPLFDRCESVTREAWLTAGERTGRRTDGRGQAIPLQNGVTACDFSICDFRRL